MRQTLVAVLLAVVIATSAVSVGAALGNTVRNSTVNEADNTSTDTDWPAPRADAGRTGATDETGPQPYGNVSWYKRSGNGAGGGLPGAVVSGNTLYMAYGGQDPPDGFVQAYNATSGQTEWRQPNVGEPVGSPTVKDDRIYVATYGPESQEFTTEDMSGLYALDASTGVIEWRQNDTITTPVVANGQIFTRVHQEGSDRSPSAYRNVTALDPETGERVWTSDVHGKPVGYANGSLYVADNQTHTIYALDPSNGALQWQTTVAEDANFDGGIAVTDETIVFTNDRGPFRSTFDPQPQKTVYAHSASDGAKLWERNVSANLTGSSPQRLSAPAIANGTVYLTSDDNYDNDITREDVGGQDVGAVHALDAETGETVWRFQTSVSLTSAPAVANGTVYAVGIEGKTWENTANAVYALDAENGAEEWNLSGARGMTPVWTAVADGQLFVTNHFHSGLPEEWSIQAIKTTDTQPPPEYQIGDDEPVAQNLRPRAQVTLSPPPHNGAFPPNTTVTLNASDSFDVDGEIVAYHWDVDGDGEFDKSGQTVEVTTFHPIGAEKTVRLRVLDDSVSEELRTISTPTIELGLGTYDEMRITLKTSDSALSPVDDFENPPTDPDGDGRFEDVNGDGEFDIVDVQALFANRNDPTIQNNPEKFDFNGDGEFDVVDVQALFTELTEEK